MKLNKLRSFVIKIDKICFSLIIKPGLILKKYKNLIIPLLGATIGVFTLLEYICRISVPFINYLFSINNNLILTQINLIIPFFYVFIIFIAMLMFFNVLLKIKPADISKYNETKQTTNSEKQLNKLIKNNNFETTLNLNIQNNNNSFFKEVNNNSQLTEINNTYNSYKENKEEIINNNIHTSFKEINNNHNLKETNNTYNSFYEEKEKTIKEEVVPFEIKSKIIEQIADKFQNFFQKTNSNEEDIINLFLLNKNAIKNDIKLYKNHKQFCFILYILNKNSILKKNEALDIYSIIKGKREIGQDNLQKYFSEFKLENFITKHKKDTYKNLESDLELIIRNNIKSINISKKNKVIN
ncbi:hypothetical protein [Wenyingzhuangia sp. 2_MG-2023]|uniref:hypothetical protein n=1 Tax=Wenyingzhuangia sp. 2_MG-2023 TaxID=3062639 RepID=UPI0026E35C7E|nr:hypothetical protein [Wenyingzhuangia sp. 2_MG-2023]MDO6737392.1 hypothetical protein [Wenyingzhuangia sp. 2_MG-2023]